MSTHARDIRDEAAYREAEALHRLIRRPGGGQVSDASDLHVSPDGHQAIFSGVIVDQREGELSTRICHTDLVTGNTRILSHGPHQDRLPRFSCDGLSVAFLSDRKHAGDFQLYLLDPASGATRAAPVANGWIEDLQWSPDGRHILLSVAGHGAEAAGARGAIQSERAATELPAWMPTVEAGNEAYQWRAAWLYGLESRSLSQVSPAGLNIWEAAWCGNRLIAAVVSPGPSEGLWFTARVAIIDLETGVTREVYRPERTQSQLGCVRGAPSGLHLAVIEGICSDRCVMAGDLRVIDIAGDAVQRVDSRGVEITYLEWRSERRLLLAGHRGFESVVATYDISSQVYEEVWSSQDVSAAGLYMSVSGVGADGDCALIGESFRQAPEIAVIERGRYRSIRSFDLGYAQEAKAIGSVERLTWSAADGLAIQGWLLRPQTPAPHPLILSVHGGPVWHIHPFWLGRTVTSLMLLKRGYAVFFPNARGSSGRGQAFTARVLGDMGGADARDLLAGVDHLIECGIADPARLGVMGGSYGGFMTSWLITQDNRFAAAVSVSPINNWITEQLLSNCPFWVSLFLADSYVTAGGRYFQRSPIMHAHKAKTPTLHITGGRDRGTPPEEAVQFHHALIEHGAESVLVIYPQEGHGIRKFPAVIDFNARIVGWFQKYMLSGTADI